MKKVKTLSFILTEEREYLDAEAVKTALSYALAADIHDAWRATRLKDDGTYEPRLRETIDKEWIKSIVFFKNIKKESGSLNYSLFLC